VPGVQPNPVRRHYDQSSTAVNPGRGRTAVALALLLFSCGRSDASIQRDVRSRLVVDNTTTAMDLNVTADHGAVRLSGVVRSRVQYQRALEIAREVVGAEKVVNDMRLDEHPLARAVYAAVQRDPLVAKVPLSVDVLDPAVVVIRSNRTTEEQRTRLIQIASQVPGVSRVDAYMK
jgi:osmotically-inducible protein OsmY